MGVEIERKFLLRNETWRAQADEGVYFHQGYLSTTPERVVRVRLQEEVQDAEHHGRNAQHRLPFFS